MRTSKPSHSTHPTATTIPTSSPETDNILTLCNPAFSATGKLGV
jgi:hypothetical protein